MCCQYPICDHAKSQRRGWGGGYPLVLQAYCHAGSPLSHAAILQNKIHIWKYIAGALTKPPNLANLVSMTGKPQKELTGLLREIELGPAMRRLNEKQQNFVYAMIEFGGLNNSKAAQAAGYEGGPDSLKVTGYRLAHDSKIQEAMREMGPRMLNAGLFIAARFVLETIDNPQIDTKDRLKAAEMVMNRTGMHATSEHKVAVTHKDETSDEMIKRIEALSKNLGIDSKKLLGNIIEAEFEEVPVHDENDLSDIL